MVLADTSVWIDHFNRTDETLKKLLLDYNVVIHPYIIGELACGNIKNRSVVMGLLHDLPCLKSISEDEYYLFIEQNKLFGMGLGFVDIHLLAASILSGCSVYTRDKNLLTAAIELKVAFQ